MSVPTCECQWQDPAVQRRRFSFPGASLLVCVVCAHLVCVALAGVVLGNVLVQFLHPTWGLGRGRKDVIHDILCTNLLPRKWTRCSEADATKEISGDSRRLEPTSFERDVRGYVGLSISLRIRVCIRFD